MQKAAVLKKSWILIRPVGEALADQNEMDVIVPFKETPSAMQDGERITGNTSTTVFGQKLDGWLSL
jgi:hypothetical protein